MRRNRGQVLVLSAVLLSVVLGLVGAFITYLGGVRKATNTFSARAAARQAAQAGIQKAIWCLNQPTGTHCGGTYGATFAGETGVSIGSAVYTTTIATLAGTLKTVTATGYYPSVALPISTVTLKADVGIDTVNASFFYGVQSGNGGFELGNNAFVSGNLYANGPITGSSGSYVTGTVYVAGGTALTADQEQTNNTSDYVFGQVSPTLDIAQSFQVSADNVLNKVSFYIKKTSNPTDVTVRILADDGGVPSKTVIGSTTLSSSAISTSYAWVDASFTTPPPLLGGQTYWLSIDATTSATKYWTIGSLANNGYGNGIGMVSANWNASPPVWNDAGRDYAFKVWLGGIPTNIDGVHVYLDAHANTIEDSTIDGDAYYQTLTDSTVGGTSHPGSADPGPADLAISDAEIDAWKASAQAGGTISGDVSYDGTNSSLGPKEITGNLTVTNGATLTLDGTIYVHGNITLNNNAIIKLAPGYGSNSGVIAADGRVIISNGVSFENSGTEGSYVIVVTTNNSVDDVNPAMSLGNNSSNSIFYAPDGLVSVANNATIKEVTAFKLKLDNNASVQYESGLANVNFSSGPGASWILKSGTTREIH